MVAEIHVISGKSVLLVKCSAWCSTPTTNIFSLGPCYGGRPVATDYGSCYSMLLTDSTN